MTNKVMTEEVIESAVISEAIAEGDKRRYLLTDESYQRLRNLQQRIFEATELSPSLRKLINALVTDEALENVSNRLIKSLEVM